MSARVPRLRMFAGPNGSGKSTLKSVLPKELLGVYLNPDETEQEIRKLGFLDFAAYGVTTTADEVLPFFKDSSFLISNGLRDMAKHLDFADGRLDFGKVEVNSYYVFDNSGDNKDKKPTWFAEITDGRVLELKSDRIPAWFKRSVLDKINPPT